jgi:hypothetical protein
MPCEEKLRDEVIGFQKAKSDILLWKLIAIGGVGAAGLGVTGQPAKEAVLVIIPFVAAYCDAVGHDYDLRIALIATFLRRAGGEFSEYESFVAGTRSRWSLVGLAAHLGASIIACVLVLLAGLFRPSVSGCKDMTSNMLVAAAILGIILVILVECEYRLRLAKLAKDPPTVTKIDSAERPV